MLLADQEIEVPEAFLRNELELKEGAFVSQVPAILQSFGFRDLYVYLHDLTIEQLTEAVRRGPAIVFVKALNMFDGHALVVDEIADDLIAIRDPLPESEGKAYRVLLADFLGVWIRPQTGRGQAAVMLG
jgi:hypothetical protein